MTDIVKAHALVVRLRSGDPRANFWKICADTIEAQASEIERLRAEVKTLRNKIASLKGQIEEEVEAER